MVRWPLFIPFSMKEGAQTSRTNFFGFTRRDLTPVSCWKRTQNGNRPRPFTKSLRPQVEPGPMKRGKGSIGFASNTFCDGNDARLCPVFFLLLALKRLILRICQL